MQRIWAEATCKTGSQHREIWLKEGRPFPDWVFASVTGTALDESNVRRMLNPICDAAELRRRGPHQMRYRFASLRPQSADDTPRGAGLPTRAVQVSRDRPHS